MDRRDNARAVGVPVRSASLAAGLTYSVDLGAARNRQTDPVVFGIAGRAGGILVGRAVERGCPGVEGTFDEGLRTGAKGVLGVRLDGRWRGRACRTQNDQQEYVEEPK